MKVGLVFDGSLDKADGVAQYVLTLGQWLRSKGHEVHYLVGETKRTDLGNLHSLSRTLTVRFNQNKVQTPLPASKAKIKKLLQDVSFDVLHVQMPYSPFMAARVVKAAGSKTAVVGTFHIMPASTLVHAGTKALGLWLGRNLRRFSRFISVSTVAQKFAVQTFGIDSEVIPNTAPLERFFGAKPFAADKRTRNVVFLGRLVERKGCQYLLDAVAKLQRDGAWPSDTKVIVCGSGPLQLKLTQFVHEAGLTDTVVFKGFVSEEYKPRFLAAADVAVFPSTGGESFGIVLIEAMAASRGIVLAGNNPGYASVMHDHPESLFDPHDIDALATKLQDLLANPSRLSSLVNWQRTFVKRFEPDIVGAQVLAVYQDALQRLPK